MPYVYTDMLHAMSRVVQLSRELTLLERGLFSRACHSVVDEKCAVWHILTSFQLEQGGKGNQIAKKAAREFQFKVDG
jgi:hypothetical protein